MGRTRLPSPVSRLPRNTGFTLIEILAAFVIFALAFGAVMHALGGSMRNTVQSRGYTQAALQARSLMDELGLTLPLEPGHSAGRLEDGYRYEMQVSEYEVEDEPVPLPTGETTGGRDRGRPGNRVRPAADGNIRPTVQLYHVDLTVRWGEPPREHEVTFTTLRAVQAEL